MENKCLQVIIILRPTPNIQSFPIIFSTSLIPSSVYSIRNYHTTATPLSSSSSTNPAGHSWHQPCEIIGYLSVINFLHSTHDLTSKISCETKEDITVVIRNICHYTKLQKILCKWLAKLVYKVHKIIMKMETAGFPGNTGNFLRGFYVLLTVHPCIILQIKPTWCTIFLNMFINLYIFRGIMFPSSG